MKGMVFTEFLEMVESTWSFDMVDTLINQAGVNGAYTAVGTYPHGELVALVRALSAETDTPVPELIRAFGSHLFGRFAQSYPRFFQGVDDSFSFLEGIENVIHAEVRKLYPDAQLPSFEIQRLPDGLAMTYYSDHPFADLAQGLIEGCIRHFGDGASVDRRSPPADKGAQALFIIRRAP